MWSFYGLLVAIMLAIDPGLNRKNHEISFREWLTWTVIWISLALIFNAASTCIWGRPRRWSSLPDTLLKSRLGGQPVCLHHDLFVLPCAQALPAEDPQVGHRALYFLLSNVMGMFIYLKLGCRVSWHSLWQRCSWLIPGSRYRCISHSGSFLVCWRFP